MKFVSFLFLVWVALASSASTGQGGANGPQDEENLVGTDCRSRNGEEGVCVTFKNCYPVIVGFEQINLGYDQSSQLLEDVLESTTPCAQSKIGGRRDKNDVVCCTSMKEKPSTDVRIIEALQSEDGTDSNSNSTEPIVESSCTGANVVNIADHFGSNAPKGAYPFMAALTSKGRQFCGGSAIDNYHVLTAAHCVTHLKTPDQLDKVRILFGTVNLQTPDADRQSLPVSSIMYHGNYSDQTIINDVAIIRLAKPIQFNQYVQPVCLNRVDDYSDGTKMATLAGFGRTSVIGIGGSPTLRHATMRVWNNTECAAKYKDLGEGVPTVEPTMVCAGSTGTDACQGDSGGPLSIKRGENSYFEQIAIVSWGVGCGCCGYPAVYTRVEKYMDWIDTNRQRNMKAIPRTQSS